MKKFQLNKQKLNLRNLATPLLALSLMAGCAGLFGGNVSAASVTTTVSLDAAHPSAPMSDFRNIIVAPTISSDWSSYVIEAGSTAYFSADSVMNPCTTTPVDMSLSISITPSSGINASMADGMVIGIYDGSSAAPLSQLNIDLNGSSDDDDDDFSTKSGTVNLLATTVQNIGFGIYSEGSTIGGESSQIHSFTYTLTYPDNMPDCTYPAANSAPTANPDTATTPANTPITTNVLSNDSDPDGDTLTISKINDNSFTVGVPITLPDGSGTVAVNADNTVTFVPAVGFTGTTSYTYNNSDGNSQSYATVTITVTASTTPALYCPSPYSITTLLTPSGDCDEDGITNQTEGFDPDGDGNPSTGTAPIDTDGDGKPDYLDLDSDNDGILDTEEKGTLSNSSTNPSDVDSDGTPDFRDLDSDNDSTKDVLESGRNNLDTNNDGRIDGTTNTYGIPSSAASTTNPKALASTSLKDSDNNGTPDYRQSSRNGAGVLAKTGQSLKTITVVAVMALGIAGYVKVKNKNSREQSYRRR